MPTLMWAPNDYLKKEIKKVWDRLAGKSKAGVVVRCGRSCNNFDWHVSTPGIRMRLARPFQMDMEDIRDRTTSSRRKHCCQTAHE
eukprot:8627114-Heterocapsa_arctica.AAC.1